MAKKKKKTTNCVFVEIGKNNFFILKKNKQNVLMRWCDDFIDERVMFVIERDLCAICVWRKVKENTSRNKNLNFFLFIFYLRLKKKMFYSAAYQMLFFDFCLFSNDQKKKVEKVLFFMYAWLVAFWAWCLGDDCSGLLNAGRGSRFHIGTHVDDDARFIVRGRKEFVLVAFTKETMKWEWIIYIF